MITHELVHAIAPRLEPPVPDAVVREERVHPVPVVAFARPRYAEHDDEDFVVFADRLHEHIVEHLGLTFQHTEAVVAVFGIFAVLRQHGFVRSDAFDRVLVAEPHDRQVCAPVFHHLQEWRDLLVAHFAADEQHIGCHGHSFCRWCMDGQGSAIKTIQGLLHAGLF